MAEQIVVTDSMLDSLRATRPWVKFIAILWFVFFALMVLGSLIMLGASSLIPAKAGMPGLFGPLLGVLYLLMAVLFCLLPGLYLNRYAKAIAAIPQAGQSALEQALFQQKTYWRYMGILIATIVVIYVLILVGAVAVGVMTAMAHHG